MCCGYGSAGIIQNTYGYCSRFGYASGVFRLECYEAVQRKFDQRLWANTDDQFSTWIMWGSEFAP